MNPSIILSENFLEYPEVSSERERPPVVTGMFYPPVVKHTESWEIRTIGFNLQIGEDHGTSQTYQRSMYNYESMMYHVVCDIGICW